VAARESWPGRAQTSGGWGAHRPEGAGMRPELTRGCLIESSPAANSGGVAGKRRGT
jgi:hypothetical protein